PSGFIAIDNYKDNLLDWLLISGNRSNPEPAGPMRKDGLERALGYRFDGRSNHARSSRQSPGAKRQRSTRQEWNFAPASCGGSPRKDTAGDDAPNHSADRGAAPLPTDLARQGRRVRGPRHARGPFLANPIIKNGARRGSGLSRGRTSPHRTTC